MIHSHFSIAFCFPKNLFPSCDLFSVLFKVTRHVTQVNLPVTMGSVFLKHGNVTLMMIVVTILMRRLNISVVCFIPVICNVEVLNDSICFN